ncbi:hypothetical protein ACFL5G_00465 [Candidatus Margulisiibacteriota bacterium]
MSSKKLCLNNAVLLDQVVLCHSFLSKARGFLFYLKPPAKALLLENTQMIHMFCMCFELAIFVLDEKLNVLDKFSLRPWQISKYYRLAKYFLEVPRLDFLEKIKVGDSLQLK